MSGGREVHSLGAEQLRARAPMVLRRGLEKVSTPAEVEWRVILFILLLLLV
jgi:hypothetical protein